MKLRLFWICLCLAYNLTLLSQRTEGPPRSIPENQSGTPLQIRDTGPDTTIYNYFYFDHPTKKYVYSDTLIDRIDRHDPAWKSGDEHFTLGNQGSAAIPVRYEVQKSLGLKYGYQQFDLYNFELDSIKIYDINRPLNDLFFTPRDGQANFQVKSRFSRSFRDNVSLHIDYRRINQDGFYQTQFTKNTNFSASVHVNRKKYKALYTLLINNNNQENNGGIVESTDFTNLLFRRRSNVLVNLEESNARREERIFSFKNEWSLLSSKKNDLSLHYDLAFGKESFRSSDNSVINDSVYYKSFWVDPRGLRNALSSNTIENKGGLSFALSDLIQLRTGIRHKYHKIGIARETRRFNELALEGRLDAQYANFFLRVDGELGLGDIAGDFNLKSNILFSTSQIRFLAGIQLFRFTPNYNFEHLALNEEIFWNNDFVKPFGTSLHGTVEIPFLKLKAGIKQILKTNALYWDSLYQPQQLGDILSVTQFNLSHKLKIGPIGLDHDFLYQISSSPELSLPDLLLTQRIYLQFKLFGKSLETQAGIEGNYLNEYAAYSYFPLTGSFANTENRIQNYYRVNTFVNVKVSQFRFFLRYVNLNSLWELEPFYQIQNYPNFDYHFRMGVRWILKD